MAIIGKIRQFSGLTIGVVAVALAAFVLGDLGRRNWSRGTDIIGEIAGKDISYVEFERAVAHQQNLMRLNRQQTNFTNEELFSIREQVWNHFVDSITYGDQYEKIGMIVSSDEMSDLIYGETPHQYIVSSFTNPETGAIDKEYMLNFFSNLDQLPLEQRAQVSNLLTVMHDETLRTKYRNLLNKSYYAPTAFAEMRYKDVNEKVVLDIVQIPYSSIADSTVTLTDTDYQKYYDAHKESYKQEENRKIEYVIFDIRPSASDISEVDHQMNRIYNEFLTIPAQDVPYFVNNNTDAAFYDSTWKTQSALPAQIAEAMFSNSPGLTIAPYRNGNMISTSRLMAESMRSDTLEAEHILIAYQGLQGADSTSPATKERAWAFADSLAKVLQKPGAMPFAIYAMQYSKDPSVSQNMGNLGKFADGQMVPSFNEAVQKGKKGDIVTVESDFGIHIIKIGEKTAPQKMVRVATITHEIKPSSTTMNGVYSQASKFSIENRTLEAFRTAAEAANYNVREMDNVLPMSNYVNGVTQPRQLIRWTFGKDSKGKEVKINDVSEVINSGDNQLVVAALVEIHPKGYATMESKKSTMQLNVMREKKGDILLEKVKGQTDTDLNAIAEKFDGVKTDAPIQLAFNAMSLPNFGREPNVIGTAFGIKENAFNGPIKGFNGIYFIKETEHILAEPKEDYNEERTQLQTGFSSRATVFQNVLREKAGIKDKRYIFY